MAERSPQLLKSDLNLKQLDDRMKNDFWTGLSQNIVICLFLAEQLFAPAFDFGK